MNAAWAKLLIQSKVMRYAIVIESAPGSSNLSAYVPDLPGSIATGKSIEEIKRLTQEAIEFHIEGLREDGLPVPEPSTQVAVVEVGA
jgi:predicted RNase H-like HicB family nuclease